MEASALAAKRLREQPKLPVSLGSWGSSDRLPGFDDHQDVGESVKNSIELKDFVEKHDMILICSANFVGQLKDTLVGSLSIFGVKADFLPHLHQILNYFIKCKTLPAYLSDTAQNIPEVLTQRASKE